MQTARLENREGSTLETLSTADKTKAEIYARMAEIRAYCITWEAAEEQESEEQAPGPEWKTGVCTGKGVAEPEEVPTALHVAPSTPTEEEKGGGGDDDGGEDSPASLAVPPSFGNHTKIHTAIKYLCKNGHQRLISNGEGWITNGHWLVMLDGEAKAALPLCVELKDCAFPLTTKAMWSVEYGLDHGEETSIPEMDQVVPADQGTPAALASERRYVKRLVGAEVDVYEVVPARGHTGDTVFVNAAYVDKLLALNGCKATEFPSEPDGGVHFETTDELSPVVLHVCEGIKAIIMPMRK